jgi:hypothetical protein
MDIKIAANAYIVMDEDDAIDFKGKYSPPKFDADGNDMPEGYKMIRIVAGAAVADEKTFDEAKKPEANVCVACRYQAANAKDLEEHAKSSHAGQAMKDEAAEEALKKRGNQKAS